MFSSRKIGISQSVLVAQAALIQALEVLKGEEIRLSDLEVHLDKIIKADSPARPVDNRKIALKGHAQTVDKTGRPSAPFKFYLELLLVQWEDWQVVESRRNDLTIDELVTNGVTDFTLYWEDSTVFITMIHNNDLRIKWLVGKNRFDRTEKPI